MQPETASLDAMPRGHWEHNARNTAFYVATHVRSYTPVELDYNVMAHAQKTVFVYGRNGRVHIL
jgi:hypothetical protein